MWKLSLNVKTVIECENCHWVWKLSLNVKTVIEWMWKTVIECENRYNSNKKCIVAKVKRVKINFTQLFSYLWKIFTQCVKNKNNNIFIYRRLNTLWHNTMAENKVHIIFSMWPSTNLTTTFYYHIKHYGII